MSTGMWVAIIGAVVTAIGWWMGGTMLGAGIIGFGLAHIVLGLIDAVLNRQSPVTSPRINQDE